jgi:preprotein translocase subunit SecG
MFFFSLIFLAFMMVMMYRWGQNSQPHSNVTHENNEIRPSLIPPTMMKVLVVFVIIFLTAGLIMMVMHFLGFGNFGNFGGFRGGMMGRRGNWGCW